MTPAALRRRPATVVRRARVDGLGILTAYAVCLLLIPAHLVFGPLGGVGTPATLFALLALLWYLAGWITGRRVPGAGSKPVRVAILVFDAAVLASFAAAMLRDISGTEVMAAERGLIAIVAWTAVVVICSDCIDRYERLDRLLRVVVVLGAVMAAIGIFQFLTGFDITRLIVIPGLTRNADYATLLHRDEFNRPSSTANHPIEFGVVLAMLLPIAVQQAFDKWRGTPRRRWLPVLLIAVALPMTVSRSGILGMFIVGLCLFPTWAPARQRRSFVAVLFGAVVMRLMIPGLLGTIRNLFTNIGADSSTTYRTQDYAAVEHYAAQAPYFGRGFGTFLPQAYRILDNQYLLGLVETGLVGLAAFLGLMLVGLRCAVLGRRHTTDPSRRALGQGLVASMAVAAVSFVTFDALSFSTVSGLFFLILGCTGAYLRLATEQRTAEAPTEALAILPPAAPAAPAPAPAAGR